MAQAPCRGLSRSLRAWTLQRTAKRVASKAQRALGAQVGVLGSGFCCCLLGEPPAEGHCHAAGASRSGAL